MTRLSDLSPEEHQELIDNRKTRDQRFALIEQSLDIETELRDSKTLGYILHRVAVEKADVSDALADMDEGRTRLNHLQARALMCRRFGVWIREMIAAGRAAEAQIAAEDGRLPADE